METLKDIPNTPTNFMFLKQRVLELAGRTTEQPPPLLDNVVGSKRLMYQSISSLTNQRRIFFERANSPSPSSRHKESAKNRRLGQKNCAKILPRAQLFSKIQQRSTKHEIEIVKNSNETLIAALAAYIIGKAT